MGLLDGILGGGGGGGILGGILGGGGGGGGLLSGLPIVGNLLGGGQRAPAAGIMPQLPMGPMPWMSPGGFMMPPSQGAWPTAQQPKQSFTGDFSKPGAAEGYWQQNQGKWGQPTNAGQYWSGVSGRAAPQSSNNAASAYQSFAGSTPTDTSPYYDRAAQRSVADIQRAAAATGQLGAGTTLRRIQDTSNAIRASQAQNDAQYGLSRGGLLGQLASGADASQSRAIGDQLGWLTGMGGLANLADQGILSRLNAGMGAASAAQEAMRARGQDFFGNNLAMGNAMAGPLQNVYGQQIMADQGLLDQMIQASLGYPREQANQAANAKASTEQGLGSLLGMGAAVKGAGGLGGILGGIL